MALSRNRRLLTYLSLLAVAVLAVASSAAGGASAVTKPLIRKPVIGKPAATPAKPVAGRVFIVSFPVTRSDTGTRITTARVICHPSVAGRAIQHKESFRAGIARVTLVLPTDTGRKLLKIKVTIKAGGGSATTNITTYIVPTTGSPAPPITTSSTATGPTTGEPSPGSPATPPTTTTTAPTPKPDLAGSFVARAGATLTVGGDPYRFVGINIYMAASGGTPSSCGGALYPDVGVPLSNMPSGVVFRFWAFQNFFVSNGRFDWTNLDRVLAIAAAHGDRAIPVLANQYDYCDGAAKDLAWYQSGYENRISAGELVPYEQYVAAVVTRYANNPTIAMWQLVNEAQATNANGSCDESTALGALIGFSDAVGEEVHHLDPNHLVSLGAIAGYSGSGRQWCGTANSDYQTLMASPGSDVCDFHDYGYPSDPMSSAPSPDLASAIQMCHQDGKPLMVGETGIYASSDGALPQRAAEFSAKFAAQFQAGVVGELMWGWVVKPQYQPSESEANYGIFPGDPSLGVLSRFINSS